jgi:hypothetical protein
MRSIKPNKPSSMFFEHGRIPITGRRSIPLTPTWRFLTTLLTVGVYFTETDMRGDCLHNQFLTLPTEPTHLAVTQAGPPQEMAHRAADWFRDILQRPIVRYEWLREGRVYAQRWLFADSGYSLVEGRVHTGELGPPDRRIHIRGDQP